MKKILVQIFLVLIATLTLAGCNYETRLTAITSEDGMVELGENPDSVETRGDVRLNLRPIRNGNSAKFSNGRMTIEYKQGATTVATVEVGDKTKPSTKTKASMVVDGNGEIAGFVPFPLMADSAFVTIAGKIDGKWLERMVIVIKKPEPPPPIELKVSIIAEGAVDGILVVPEGSLVVLYAVAEGGRQPYTFIWTNPKGEVVGQNQTLTLKNFSCKEAGVYSVEVIDAEGKSAKS